MIKNLFKGKKVLIMGLGLHGGGVSAAKFFYKQKAEVLVTDLKTEDKLKESFEKLKSYKKIRYTLGKHEEADFINADLIIRNPDVPASSPYLKVAGKNNVPVETDVSLFFKYSKAFIIGVTGTKGKSTTASLIYHILKSKFKRTFLAGNIGVSPLELLAKIKKGDKVVLELSSFELEGLTQSPNIAVVTNIMPDHLNRYASMAEYVEAKKTIFKFQNKKDYLILNSDDSIVRQMSSRANGKIVLFSKIEPPKEFKLFGEHNLYNLSAAIEVAKILKISAKNINKALKTFGGVPSRQEFVKEVNGVKYFNDTTATIPEAVISAINSFSIKFPDSRIFLICGGVYKGVDYKQMTSKIKEKHVELIMLPGSGSDKIKESLGNYQTNDVSSMQEAVKRAGELAREGDLVILSPAASSFNMFKNEFDRGDQFVESVRNLK